MNSLTSFMDYWSRKVAKLTIIDLKLIQIGSMALALINVKLLPQIMSVNILWFVLPVIVYCLRTFYVFWVKDE